MTVNQALVISLVIAVLITITGTEITNNTTFLILLLIALIALAKSSNNFCPNRFNSQNFVTI